MIIVSEVPKAIYNTVLTTIIPKTYFYSPKTADSHERVRTRGLVD